MLTNRTTREQRAAAVAFVAGGLRAAIGSAIVTSSLGLILGVTACGLVESDADVVDSADGGTSSPEAGQLGGNGGAVSAGEESSSRPLPEVGIGSTFEYWVHVFERRDEAEPAVGETRLLGGEVAEIACGVYRTGVSVDLVREGGGRLVGLSVPISGVAQAPSAVYWYQGTLDENWLFDMPFRDAALERCSAEVLHVDPRGSTPVMARVSLACPAVQTFRSCLSDQPEECNGFTAYATRPAFEVEAECSEWRGNP